MDSFFQSEEARMDQLWRIVSGMSIALHRTIVMDLQSGDSHLRVIPEFSEITYTRPQSAQSQSSGMMISSAPSSPPMTLTASSLLSSAGGMLVSSPCASTASPGGPSHENSEVSTASAATSVVGGVAMHASSSSSSAMPKTGGVVIVDANTAHHASGNVVAAIVSMSMSEGDDGYYAEMVPLSSSSSSSSAAVATHILSCDSKSLHQHGSGSKSTTAAAPVVHRVSHMGLNYNVSSAFSSSSSLAVTTVEDGVAIPGAGATLVDLDHDDLAGVLSDDEDEDDDDDDEDDEDGNNHVLAGAEDLPDDDEEDNERSHFYNRSLISIAAAWLGSSTPSPAPSPMALPETEFRHVHLSQNTSPAAPMAAAAAIHAITQDAELRGGSLVVDSCCELPSIDQIYQFLFGMYKRGDFMPVSAVGSLILIHRLKSVTGLAITTDNWKCVCVITLLVSQKLFEDVPLANGEFALLYPVLNKKVVSQLEIFFYKLLKFEVSVEYNECLQYIDELYAVSSQPRSLSRSQSHGATSSHSPSSARRLPPSVSASPAFIAPSHTRTRSRSQHPLSPCRSQSNTVIGYASNNNNNNNSNNNNNGGVLNSNSSGHSRARSQTHSRLPPRPFASSSSGGAMQSSPVGACPVASSSASAASSGSLSHTRSSSNGLGLGGRRSSSGASSFGLPPTSGSSRSSKAIYVSPY